MIKTVTGRKGSAMLTFLFLLSIIIMSPALADNSLTVSGVILPNVPVAQFSATPTSGGAPLAVMFTDQSTGSITAWAWDFNNDGVIDSTLQNPAHTYNAGGTYTVKLAVTGPGGSDTEFKAGYITVKTLDADFSATPLSGISPLTVKFTDRTTGNPTSWRWDFNNDGIIDSTSRNPTYKYLTTGTFTVKLTVSNAAGSDTEIKPGYINVNGPPPLPPVAAFSANKTSGNYPLTVKFTDTSIRNPTAWAWDFNNDGVIDSTLQNPVYTYGAAGKYTVKLTVSNAGGSDSQIKNNYITVTSPIRPPVAGFTQDKYIGSSPLTVKFRDQSANNPTEYYWTFGDGSTSTEKDPVHIYTKTGLHLIRLKVTNAVGNDTAQSMVIVINPRYWW